MRKGGDLQDVVEKVERILAREAARQSPEDERSLRGITGRLENLGLPEIFQILNLGVKTARLTLNTESQAGVIWFSEGAAVHAELGDKAGVDACYDMLRWSDGEFRIEHGLTTDLETIDLDPIVREQVLLALPVSVLCQEDCRGLCTVCGQDLNEKDCGCERKVVDVRLAKLKDIKLNN